MGYETYLTWNMQFIPRGICSLFHVEYAANIGLFAKGHYCLSLWLNRACGEGSLRQ